MAPAQLVDAKDLPPELQAKPAARTVAVVTAADQAPETTAADPQARAAASAAGAAPAGPGWLAGLEHDARAMLRAGEPTVWETLTRRFEAQLIQTALEITRGRRIEAAQKLGIGRNTITRKIQELGLDEK
jgi:two-component system nitrogen regulation response regulator GlnG